MFAVAEGKDPQAERKAERGTGTFDDLASKYLEVSKKKNKSWKQADTLVRKHLRPKWGKLNAENVSRSDVKAMMTRIAAPIVANQTLAAATAIYTCAVRQELGLKSIRVRRRKKRDTVPRARALRDGAPLFWKAFDQAGVQGAALKVILLLGQRPGEIFACGASTLWMAGGTCRETLPASLGLARDEKTSKPIASGFQLPPGRRHCSLEGGGFRVRRTARRPVIDLDEKMRDICAKLGFERATPHDLRRTNGTPITGLGFGREPMNRIQNHREGGIAESMTSTNMPKRTAHP